MLEINDGRPCFPFSGNPVRILAARALSLAEYAGLTRRNLQKLLMDADRLVLMWNIGDKLKSTDKLSLEVKIYQSSLWQMTGKRGTFLCWGRYLKEIQFVGEGWVEQGTTSFHFPGRFHLIFIMQFWEKFKIIICHSKNKNVRPIFVILPTVFYLNWCAHGLNNSTVFSIRKVLQGLFYDRYEIFVF